MALRPAASRLTLPPARLYLEDVHSLIHLLEKHIGSVSIESGEREADSVDDLLTLGTDSIHRLVLGAYQSDIGITIVFRPGTAWVHAHGHNPLASGVAQEVHQLVSFRRQPIAAAIKAIPMWLVWLFNVVVWLYLIFTPRSQFHLTEAKLIGLGVFCAASCWLLWKLSARHSVIVLRHRKDAPSFWKRKGDEVVLNIITGVGGAVIGFGLGRAYDRLAGPEHAPPVEQQRPQSTDSVRPDQVQLK